MSNIEAKNRQEVQKEQLTEKNALGKELRYKIEQIVNNKSYQEGISGEELKMYKDFLKGEGAVKLDDTKMMRGMLSYMEKELRSHEVFKLKFFGSIDKAIQEKELSKKDIDFYKVQLAKRVFNGEKNVVHEKLLDEALKDLEKSLKNRKAEKKEFEKTLHHPLAKEGELKTGKDLTYKLLNEEGYLKLSVPERRAYLKESAEALKKAEGYQKTVESIEAPQLQKDYTLLLFKAHQHEKVMGASTVKKFLSEFNELKSLEEKKYWISELKNGNQLKRYRLLWKDIRSTFKGSALKEMENSREKMGYSQLLNKLDQVTKKEEARLDYAYQIKLEAAQSAGILSMESKRSFMEDADGMKNQDLKGKYKYMAGLEQQMARYRRLKLDIEQLENPEQKKKLNKMYSTEGMGYSEIKTAYDEVAKDLDETTEESTETTEDLLKQITNPIIRSGVQSALEQLEKSGADKQRRMLELITNMTTGVSPSQYDNQNYEKEISNLGKEGQTPEKTVKNSPKGDALQKQRELKRRQMEAKKKALEETDKKSFAKQNKGVLDFQARLKQRKNQEAEGSSEEVSKKPHWLARLTFKRDQQPEKAQPTEVGKLESEEMNPSIESPMDTSKPTHEEMQEMNFYDEEFAMVESTNEKGQSERLAMVAINWQKGVDDMLIKDQRKRFNSKANGGSDRMHFTVKDNSDQNVALKFTEIKVFEKALRQQVG